MKILFVTARFPYPPLKGDQVRGYHQLRLLSRKHQITLVTFLGQNTSANGVSLFQSLGITVVPVPANRMDAVPSLARGLFSSYPFQTLLYQSAQMKRAIQAQVSTGQFDVAHVQLARMAPYLERENNLPRIIDLIDALSVNMERRYQSDKSITKSAAYIDWQRMRRYERTICEVYDYVTIVSESDRNAIGPYTNLRINANGVDLSKFPIAFEVNQTRKPNHLIFTGNMGYFPNVNAVEWFARKVLSIIKSKIPDVEFHIVGTNPHPRVQQLAREDQAITVTGYIADIQAYLAQATVSVVPMQAGSGMQFKVIEAMASGVPVVVTPFALGGIHVTHGQHLLIADDEVSFADAVIRLLSDDELRARLIQNGRRLVETQFVWEHLVDDLDEIYTLAAKRVRRT